MQVAVIIALDLRRIDTILVLLLAYSNILCPDTQVTIIH